MVSSMECRKAFTSFLFAIPRLCLTSIKQVARKILSLPTPVFALLCCVKLSPDDAWASGCGLSSNTDVYLSYGLGDTVGQLTARRLQVRFPGHFFVEFAHSLYLCFLRIPQLPPKDMHHWQFCSSKMSAGVNVDPLNGCSPHLPRDGWDKLQYPATPSAR